jgi:hemerythrin
LTLQWTQALATGIAEIDEQHQELFRRIDRLLDASLAGDPAEVTRMLGFLREYVDRHFAAEERFMEEQRYPGLASHRAEHVVLVEKVRLIDVEHRANGTDPATATSMHRLLSDWLRTHIGLSDASMASFVRRARRR